MKHGTRTYGASSLMAGKSKALPDHLSSIVEISALYTPEAMRGQGQATELLNRTCGEADKSRTVLMLMPDDLRLSKWYQKFGFVVIQADPIIMARQPRQ